MELKPISRDAIPAALHKAERYRFLNDSSAAESICLDVLGLEPENQAALVMLVLAISDQFDSDPEGVRRAREVLPRLKDEYKRHYYSGIICERRGKAHLRRASMGAEDVASEWLHDAMAEYEKAEAMRPAGNDEAILRWNTCARVLNDNPHLVPPREEAYEPSFE